MNEIQLKPSIETLPPLYNSDYGFILLKNEKKFYKSNIPWDYFRELNILRDCADPKTVETDCHLYNMALHCAKRPVQRFPLAVADTGKPETIQKEIEIPLKSEPRKP